MFSFICMSGKERVNGIFSDSGDCVRYPEKEPMENRPALSPEQIGANRDFFVFRVEDEESYDLDAYLQRRLHTHCYRYYPFTGERVELFTEPKDREAILVPATADPTVSRAAAAPTIR
ncbi:MAG: hypothetical protein IJ302_00675 [Clostridia bacterium]|nr:hypothetical protein [Clostridia bacterium]